MRVGEFRKQTDAELLHMADQCFAKIDGTGGVGGAPTPWELQPALLLQAQFYMNEVDRRHDASIVRRDFILELIIIFLIVAEIVFGIVEGNKQANILNLMNTSTAATATAMADLRTAQQESLTQQTKSLESLNQMNDKLKTSVQETGNMAVATQKQLGILQSEQANRLAEQAKKPKLELVAGTVALNTQVPTPVKAREPKSETQQVLDVVLRIWGMRRRGWYASNHCFC